MKDFGDHGVSVGDTALNLDDSAVSHKVGVNVGDGTVGISLWRRQFPGYTEWMC